MNNPRDFAAFFRLARPVLEHPLFESQRAYIHHDTTSVYDHAIIVAYMSFWLAKKLTIEADTVVKGALLHDFFLYDWHIEGRKSKKRGLKKHGFTHAKVAYANAVTHFEIGPIEKDIIIKHMFPLNLKPPTYVESWLVYMIDNFVTFTDYLDLYTNLKASLLEYIAMHKKLANQPFSK